MAYSCRVTVSIFLVNVTHEEGQVNVNPAAKEDGVKHVSIVKTLTRHVIPGKRMFAPRKLENVDLFCDSIDIALIYCPPHYPSIFSLMIVKAGE